MANRIVIVASRWLWVVGLRRCAGGKRLQWVWVEISIEKGRDSRDFNRKSDERVEYSTGK